MELGDFYPTDCPYCKGQNNLVLEVRNNILVLSCEDCDRIFIEKEQAHA